MLKFSNELKWYIIVIYGVHKPEVLSELYCTNCKYIVQSSVEVSQILQH